MKLRIDLFVVSGLIAIALIAWLLFGLKPLWGFLIFVLIPSIYMGIRSAKPWRKILGASLVLGLLLGAFFDLIQSYNHAWIVSRVIGWEIFGILPIDNVLGYFLMTFLVLTFYEHFFIRSLKKEFSARFYTVSAAVFVVVMLTFMVFYLKPTLLVVPYSYFVGGTIAAILVIIALLRHPENINDSLRISAYFFIVWFFVELTALTTHGWSFPGTYLGMVDIQGLRFPFEELFFWMLWYSPFLVTAYTYLSRESSGI